MAVKKFMFIVAFAPLMLLAQPSDKASLSVKIQGLEEHKGKVAIALCDENGEEIQDYWIFVEGPDVVLDLSQLEMGTYAVKFFHDANNNGTMDKNFFGVPTEMFGFSNDAKLRLGPPALEDMLFKVEGRTEIVINARKI